jgi:GxxExxY protein
MSDRPPHLIEAELTHSVIGAFYEVLNQLGHGFLEYVYSLALERELLARGHRVSREFGVQIFYKGQPLTSQRLDFVVDEKLVVEIKASEAIPKVALAQLRNYLRASRLEVGLLLYFGPKSTFYRVVATNRDGRHGSMTLAADDADFADFRG